MTEAEWLAATDPRPLLHFLKRQASTRKRRLFACECCRRMWHLLVDYPLGRQAVEVAERFADREATADELRRAAGHTFTIFYADDVPVAVRRAVDATKWVAVDSARNSTELTIGLASQAISPLSEPLAQAHILRDIFGNPFRPVAFDPAWRTSTVLALAEGIYADRAFDRLPILADALMDAGCDADDILAHCRADGPHVRGCWVVDAVLGKE